MSAGDIYLSVRENTSLEALRSYSDDYDLKNFDIMHAQVSSDRVREVDQKISAVYNISAQEFCTNVCTPDAQKVEAWVKEHNFSRLVRKRPCFCTACTLAIPPLCMGIGAGGLALINAAADNEISNVLMAGVGAMAGVAVGVVGEIILAVKMCRKRPFKAPPQMYYWKQGEIKERYELLLNALIKGLGEKQLKKELNTDFLPYIPVKKKFKAVGDTLECWDWVSLQTRLSEVWQEINSSKADSKEYFKRVDLGTGPVTEEDLIYSVDFARKKIPQLWDLWNKHEQNIIAAESGASRAHLPGNGSFARFARQESARR